MELVCSQVSLTEAKETVRLWYNDRKEVLKWQQERKEDVLTKQCVHTLLGRARRFPSIANASYAHKGHIERAAINTPVQFPLQFVHPGCTIAKIACSCTSLPLLIVPHPLETARPTSPCRSHPLIATLLVSPPLHDHFALFMTIPCYSSLFQTAGHVLLQSPAPISANNFAIQSFMPLCKSTTSHILVIPATCPSDPPISNPIPHQQEPSPGLRHSRESYSQATPLRDPTPHRRKPLDYVRDRQPGSAADVAMCAMLEIDRNARLKELGWRLLLQVLDFNLFSGPFFNETHIVGNEF
ncbi:hypothetical protein KSP40_PGU010353 [Platanthera guangdongensis]|uniref:DNA-directed DNA polymerase family A palm domain-containing protein n=1 Tax=Platanthera guangdongensis TaxID=2320717 RepID=A0ABR2MRV5_9ASPA